MHLMIKTILIATLSTFFNILIPGLTITTLLKKKYNSVSWNIDDAVSVTAVGFIFNTLLFMAGLGLIIAGLNQHSLVLSAYMLDICLLSYALMACRPQLAAAMRSFGIFMLNPFRLIGVLFITYYAFYGVLNHPHTLDSSQLKWTYLLITEQVTSFATSTGALGYSALLYFPGTLFHFIPLVTLAAGFKVILGWLFVLTTFYLAAKANFKSGFAMLVMLLLCFANHSFSEAGIYMLGKDSFFAVLFSMLFIATLFETEENRFFYVRCGLLMFCACISGVIVVPFLFVVMTLYLLFNLNTLQKPFLFVLYLVAISSVALAVAANAIMHIQFSNLAILFGILIAVVYLLRNRSFTNLNLSFFKPVYFPIFFAIMLIGLNHLFPIKVPIYSWVDALNHPVSNYYPPLDGETTLSNLIEYAGRMSHVLIMLGLLGIMTLVFNKKFIKSRILYAFALFPFCVLYIVVMFAHMKNSPFTTFNLWDMSKDVGNYYFPFLFALFAFICMDFIFSLIPKPVFFNHEQARLFSCLVVTFILGYMSLMYVSIKNYLHFDKIVYTEIGGDKLPLFANLTQTLVANKYNPETFFFMDKESPGFYYFYSYQMYSNMHYYPIDFKNIESLKSILEKKPYLIAIDKKNIGCLNKIVVEQKASVQLIKDFGDANTVLYRVF